jgi:RND family efflux transporter MFP subunit
VSAASYNPKVRTVPSDLKRDLESLRLDQADASPRRSRTWIVLVGLVLVVAVAGLLYARSNGGVQVTTVKAVSVESTGGGSAAAAGDPVLTASGYLVARREAVVSAKIQGRLSELRVEEGDVVRQGDVLARLESLDYEAQVARARASNVQLEAQAARTEAAIARAEADLAEVRRQLRQTDRLAVEQVVARDAQEAAQSRVRVGEAALEQARADRRQVDADRARILAEVQYAEAQLANTVIRAPFAGTVVKKMSEVGESVAPIPPGVNISTSSGAIVALADLATLEMEADVSESNVAKLQEQQAAEVEVEAFPEKRYRSVLRQVIPTADRTKATVQVKVTLVEKDAALKPEMSAKVTFLAPPREDRVAQPAGRRQVTAPSSAIVTRDGGTKAFEVIDGVVKVRAVVTGGAKGSDVIVTQGLSGGETLVASPPQELKDGDKVRVK